MPCRTIYRDDGGVVTVDWLDVGEVDVAPPVVIGGRRIPGDDDEVVLVLPLGGSGGLLDCGGSSGAVVNGVDSTELGGTVVVGGT